jgi:hypothetical protein
MSGGEIALLITGVRLALLGVGAATTGAGMLWAHGTQRAANGYLTSPAYALISEGHAVTAEEIHLGGPSPDDWFGRADRLEIRLGVEAIGSGPVFVGVGPCARPGLPHHPLRAMTRRRGYGPSSCTPEGSAVNQAADHRPGRSHPRRRRRPGC